MKRTSFVLIISICTCHACADSIEQMIANATSIYSSVCTNVLDRICRETNSTTIVDIDAFYLAGWANVTNAIPLLEQLIECNEVEVVRNTNSFPVQAFSTLRQKRSETPAFLALCLLPLDRFSLANDIKNNSLSEVGKRSLIQLGLIKFGSSFMYESGLLMDNGGTSLDTGLFETNVTNISEIRDWVLDYMDTHPSEQQDRYLECVRVLRRAALIAKGIHDEMSFSLAVHALEQIGRPLALDENE